MYCNRLQLKMDAKRVIRENNMKLLSKIFLYLVLISLVTSLVYNLTGVSAYITGIDERMVERRDEIMRLNTEYSKTNDDSIIDELNEQLMYISGEFPRVNPLGIAIAALLVFMRSIMDAGFKWFCLKSSRKQHASFHNIFDGFGFLFKTVLLLIIYSALISIGMTVFVVPGILFAVIYSQATYALFENPERGVFECLGISRRLMKGKIADYIALILSFFGWGFVNIFISNMIANAFAMSGLGTLTIFSSVFFGTWYSAYTGITKAGYYNWLTGYQPQEDNINDNSI